MKLDWPYFSSLHWVLIIAIIVMNNHVVSRIVTEVREKIVIDRERIAMNTQLNTHYTIIATVVIKNNVVSRIVTVFRAK